MPTIVANGLRTAYEVQGAGPPLVMLHGATSSGSEHFARLAPVLARGFRVYRPDARGHAGTEGAPADGFTTADLVKDLAAFADELGLTTFHLLGYSMGGMTALHFAASFPDRIRTLVALSIGTEREPRLPVGRSLMDPDRIERHDPGWARFLAARHDPLHGAGSWRGLLRAIVEDIAEQPLLTGEQLRSIAAPTLVAAGDRDPFTPVPQAHALSRQVRDGRLLIMPGVGHDALGDAGGLLAAALTEFYRSTEAIAPRASGRAADHGGRTMTTLLAMFRRPEGGANALAEFERRYAAEHLPLVAQTPGLRATEVRRVGEALGAETDLVVITAMHFDDRAALDAGLASDAMRAAGRNLREIAPGLSTLLVLEDAADLQPET